MTIFLRGAYALTVMAALASGLSAQAAGEADFATQLAAVSSNDTGDIQLASCCDSGGECGGSCGAYDACGGSCGGGGGCGLGGGGLGLANGLLGSGRTQFFFGAEYLSLRANFSEATSYLETDLAAGTYTWNQFGFDYTDSYRLYGWIRLQDCGGEIRFTYSNFRSNGAFDSGPLDTNGGTRSITSPFEIVTVGDGDRLSGTASVSINNYDIAFAKTIPLGSPLCCDTGCGDTCDPCNPCGSCNTCPAWDLQWSGGIRIANVDSRLGYQSTLTTANGGPGLDRTGVSSMSFDGVGLRTGLLGRRYIGQSGMFSIFVRGDISLLLGEVNYFADATGAFARNEITTTQVIPVTEIEAGATAWLTQNLSLTGGYMLSAWHDLGHRAQYDFTATGTQILGMDDANMLMLDGFFLRAEAAF